MPKANATADTAGPAFSTAWISSASRAIETFYTYLDVGLPFYDVLLVPLADKGTFPEGTIWIVAHNPTQRLDSEDARVVERLATFVATSLDMAKLAGEATS